jgi:ectoine hydroxylase-related dioxygenase (phytanoyl-CoA dioxygenase family)
MFKQIAGKLRALKLTYIVYNFFHRRRLRHNRNLYKQLHIKKPVYWNVSSEDFSKLPQHRPWLDERGAKEQLRHNKQYQLLPVATQEHILQWVDNGFIILKNFISPQQAAAINNEMDRLLEQGQLAPLDNGKIMFAFKQSALINALVHDTRITGLFEFIFQQPVIAFQTINFLKGSQQRAHSDSIHMTTYPLGYLSAAWFALEDIDAANGPLFYYPGSHHLPYVLSPDFDHKSGILQLDPHTNRHYEDKMEEVIGASKIQQQDFHAQQGDVFLWHANLIHGGRPITDMARTRKSMVVHYFAKDVIKYHEISQRPALVDE